MKAAIRSLSLALALAGIALPAATKSEAASSNDKRFFRQVSGQWSGPGEIVAGRYKGTKFVCTLQGAAGEMKPGMTLDGSCRVGVFTEKISATVEARGNGYAGRFLDGAKGEGLDVIGGTVTGDKVVLSLNRAQLKGAMIARVKGSDTMIVTVSVRVEGKMVPVLGMNLKRIDSVSVGSIAE